MKTRRRRTEGARNVLKNPVRVRILGWLAGQSKPKTKREIGRALSLSNAAVHYHLTRLEKEGLAKLVETRPGPNSITEKLYAGFSGKTIPGERKARNDTETSEFYLRYTLDSISEMHREAEQMIRSDWKNNRFLVGCFGVHATEGDIRRLRTRLLNLLETFHEKHRRPGKKTKPVAMTFGVVPSSGLAWGNTQKVFGTLS